MTQMDYLEELFASQARLQRESFGVPVGKMDDEQVSDYVRWNVLALTDELHEALKEVRWKPWATGHGFKNREAYVGELIDGLHFILNLFLVANATSDEVIQRYRDKHAVNAARQAAGYDDGQKCGGCGRALDDPTTMCRAVPGKPGFWACYGHEPPPTMDTRVLRVKDDGKKCPGCGRALDDKATPCRFMYQYFRMGGTCKVYHCAYNGSIDVTDDDWPERSVT